MYQRLESMTLRFKLMEKFFFDLPVKNEEEAYEKIIGNNDYATGNLLDYSSNKKHSKLIAIDLRKQTKLKKLKRL